MTYNERRLPNWHPVGAHVFLTWRLAGSLPGGAGGRASDFGWPVRGAGGRFLEMDRALDRAQWGPVWLKDSRLAHLVVATIRSGELERRFYQVRAFAVMPNHVHLLILPFQPLPVTLCWLKGSTAKHASGILGETGAAFWQDESYDHWVRGETELQRIAQYIERNPVSAGLTPCAELWPWSSAYGAGDARQDGHG